MAYGIEAIFYGKKKMRGGLVIGLINTVIYTTIMAQLLNPF
jgi:hypothetical protein